MNPKHVHISVCIATYKRPDMLRNLLTNTLEKQVLRDGYTFSVHICENDGLRLAESICDEFKDRFDLTYDCEPVQNISLARNKSIYMADGDFIAIIDDDDSAGPNWLQSLVDTAEDFSADVVRGPLKTVFPQGTPIELFDCGTYQTETYERGICYDFKKTVGNTLIRRSALALLTARGHLFDPEFGLTGGEDTDFFWRLQRLGRRFAWSPISVVNTELHSGRNSLRFTFRRLYKLGGTQRKMAERYRSETAEKLYVIHAIKLVVLTLIAAGGAPAWFMARRAYVKYLAKFVYHAGYINYRIFRHIHEEYRTT